MERHSIFGAPTSNILRPRKINQKTPQSHIPVASVAIAANTGEAGAIFRRILGGCALGFPFFGFSMFRACEMKQFRFPSFGTGLVNFLWMLGRGSIDFRYMPDKCSIDVRSIFNRFSIDFRGSPPRPCASRREDASNQHIPPSTGHEVVPGKKNETTSLWSPFLKSGNHLAKIQ